MTRLRGQESWTLSLLRTWGREDEAQHYLEQLNKIQRAFGKPDYDMPEPLETAEQRVRSIVERELKFTIEQQRRVA